MFKISEKIFRAYDIRGIYPQEINADLAFRLGYFFQEFLEKSRLLKSISQKKKIRIAVNADYRTSSRILKNKLIEGLLKNNFEVLDLGESSTPMFYFGIKETKSDFGIMVTASHLSRGHNGFKIFDKDITAISGERIGKFIKLFEGEIKNFSISKHQTIKEIKLLNKYINFLLKISNFSKKELNILKKLKIAVKDSGGVIKPIFNKLIPQLGLDIKIKSVNKKDSFGVVFDADGDRVYFINNFGKTISSDIVGSFLTEYFLKTRGANNIIVDERSTKLIKEIAGKYKSKVIYCQVGHSYFKVKMVEKRAILGIEKASHYYFKDFFYADAGIYAFLSFLKGLVYYQYALEDVLKKYQKYANLSEQNFVVKNQEKSIKLIENHFKNKAKNISYLDGITMEFFDWRFNLRPSNTEKFLRLNIEADNKKILQEKFKEIKKIIK